MVFRRCIFSLLSFTALSLSVTPGLFPTSFRVLSSDLDAHLRIIDKPVILEGSYEDKAESDFRYLFEKVLEERLVLESGVETAELGRILKVIIGSARLFLKDTSGTMNLNLASFYRGFLQMLGFSCILEDGLRGWHVHSQEDFFRVKGLVDALVDVVVAETAKICWLIQINLHLQQHLGKVHYPSVQCPQDVLSWILPSMDKFSLSSFDRASSCLSFCQADGVLGEKGPSQLLQLLRQQTRRFEVRQRQPHPRGEFDEFDFSKMFFEGAKVSRSSFLAFTSSNFGSLSSLLTSLSGITERIMGFDQRDPRPNHFLLASSMRLAEQTLSLLGYPLDRASETFLQRRAFQLAGGEALFSPNSDAANVVLSYIQMMKEVRREQPVELEKLKVAHVQEELFKVFCYYPDRYFPALRADTLENADYEIRAVELVKAALREFIQRGRSGGNMEDSQMKEAELGIMILNRFFGIRAALRAVPAVGVGVDTSGLNALKVLSALTYPVLRSRIPASFLRALEFSDIADLLDSFTGPSERDASEVEGLPSPLPSAPTDASTFESAHEELLNYSDDFEFFDSHNPTLFRGGRGKGTSHCRGAGHRTRTREGRLKEGDMALKVGIKRTVMVQVAAGDLGAVGRRRAPPLQLLPADTLGGPPRYFLDLFSVVGKRKSLSLFFYKLDRALDELMGNVGMRGNPLTALLQASL